MLRTFTAAALLALTFTAATFTAAQAESADAIRVAFGDLDLSNPADTKILADRLQAAARQACLVDNSDTGHVGKAVLQQCINAAVNIATAQIEDKVENSASRQLHANLVSVREQVSMN